MAALPGPTWYFFWLKFNANSLFFPLPTLFGENFEGPKIPIEFFKLFPSHIPGYHFTETRLTWSFRFIS